MKHFVKIMSLLGIAAILWMILGIIYLLIPLFI